MTLINYILWTYDFVRGMQLNESWTIFNGDFAADVCSFLSIWVRVAICTQKKVMYNNANSMLGQSLMVGSDELEEVAEFSILENKTLMEA